MKKKILGLLGKKPKAAIGVCAVAVGVIGMGLFGFANQRAKINEAALMAEANINEVDIDDLIVTDQQILQQYAEYSKARTQIVECYKLVVDDRIELYFETKEEVEKALELVQSAHIDENLESKVKLIEEVADTEEEAEFEVETVVLEEPEVPLLQKQDVERELSTSAVSAGTSVEVPSINVNTLNKPLVPADFQVASLPGATVALEADDHVKLSFNESVAIEKVYADKANFTTALEAAALLNKTNVQPKQYTVESGDSPYSIALDYDMSLDEIYALNDGLEEKAKRLQVGDVVTVEKIKPELSVVVEETVTYYDSIPKEFIRQDDPDLYETLEKVTDEGRDGTKEVTAIVKTIDGEEVSKDIIDEKVISEPVSGIIAVGTKPLPKKGAVGVFNYPVSNFTITSPYGYRRSGFHTGVDFGVPKGTSVKAADGGTVIFAGWHRSYGNLVIIDHGNGFVTKYAHNSKLLVSEGDVVGQGEEISKSGSTGNSTGPHLHFEVLIDGDTVNPIDYLD